MSAGESRFNIIRNMRQIIIYYLTMADYENLLFTHIFTLSITVELPF